MTEKTPEPIQPAIQDQVDDDLPTRELPAMKGALLAAIQAQAEAKAAKDAEAAKPVEDADPQEPAAEATAEAEPEVEPVAPAATPPVETAQPATTALTTQPPGRVHPESADRAHPEPAERAHPEPAARPHPDPADRAHPEPAERAHPEPAERAHPEPAGRAHPEEPAEPAPSEPAEPAVTAEVIAPAPLTDATVRFKPISTPAPRPVPTPVPPAPAEPVKPIFADEPVKPVATEPPAASTPPKAPAADVAGKGTVKAQKPKKRSHGLMVLLIALLVIVLSGVIALVVTSMQYNGKAKIGTSVAGVSVVGQTEDQLLATVQQLGAGLKLTLSYNGTQRDFSMSDLGVTVNPQETADAILGGNGAVSWWPFSFSNHPIALDYDQGALQKTLDDDYLGDSQEPTDATVEPVETGDEFVSVPDSQGLTIELQPVIDALNSLALGDTVDTVQLTTNTAAAAIQVGAATQAAQVANNMLAQAYTFSTDKKSYTLKAAQMLSWITFNPDSQAGAIKVGVDQDSITSELPDILNLEVANPPVNRQVLYTPDGSSQIAVQSAGQNGTAVSNSDAAVSALTTALASATPLAFAVTTEAAAYGTDKVLVGGAYDQPNGSKWIDVNQSNYHVTLYEGTTMIRWFLCVTGAPATPTVNGTFYINRKYTTTTMRGQNVDGSHYVQPDVPWTNYFYGGYALHGAPWRSSFGYRASHGCVNLRVSDAHILFDWAPLGTKVVVHW